MHHDFAATMPKHGGLCCGESGPGSRGADLVNSTWASNGFPKEAGRAIGFCSTCASFARRDVALLT